MSQLARSYQQQTQHEQRQNTRTDRQNGTSVQPKRRLITRGEKLIWSMGMVAVLFLAVTIVGKQASLYNVNNDINHIQTKIDAQTKTNNQLQVQVTELMAPERILKIAKDQFGLTLNDKNVKVLTH